jgi:hypothetical protein
MGDCACQTSTKLKQGSEAMLQFVMVFLDIFGRNGSSMINHILTDKVRWLLIQLPHYNKPAAMITWIRVL